MSRRSLRLDERLPHSSATFSAGGASWRTARSQRPHPSHWHHSLLSSPAHSLQDSVATDASLITSMLDESTVKGGTVVKTFWGLDDDADPRESTMIGDEGGDAKHTNSQTSKHPDQTPGARAGPRNPSQSAKRWTSCSKAHEANLNNVYCNDCSSPGSSSPRQPETTIYSRDRSSRTRRDVLQMWLAEATERCFSVLGDAHSEARPCSAAYRWIRSVAARRLCFVVFAVLAPLLLALGHRWFSPVLFGNSSTPAAPPPEENVVKVADRPGDLQKLWQQVEQKHREVQRLHDDLLGQRDQAVWAELLEEQMSAVRRRQEEERRRRDRSHRENVKTQKKQMIRLNQLEMQMLKLVSKMEDVRIKQEASLSEVSSTAVGLSHDALQQMERALVDLRQDVDGLRGMKTAIRDVIRDQIRALVFGDQQLPAETPQTLLELLTQRFVGVDDLQVALDAVEVQIPQKLKQQPSSGLSREEVQEMLSKSLRLFSEDQTGLADYALESGGGSIVDSSETHQTKAALLSLFGLPLWYFSQSPRAVIQPDVHPGNCWAFAGSQGFLVIRLSMPVLPTAFSLEHLPRSLAPGGAVTSAPRHFSVYGLDVAMETSRPLGAFQYRLDREALQTFAVTEENEDFFQLVKLQVESNWGRRDYTCIYRFRVHGAPLSV